MPYFASLSSPPLDRPNRDQAFEQWLATVHRVCGEFGAEPRGERFAGRLSDLSVGSLRMSLAESDQLSLFKNRQHIGHAREHCFYAVLQLSGESWVEQDQQRAVLNAGDIAVLDGVRPFEVNVSAQSRQVSLILPAHLLESRGAHGGSAAIACAQRIGANSAAGKWAGLLVQDAMSQRESALSDLEGESLLSALVSLLKPAVCSLVPDETGNYDKIYQRACTYIDAHLRDESLTPEQIAQAIGVSVRGLYRVFARQSLVVAKHIKNRRLDFCAQALRGAQGQGVNLTSLSLEWGFTDASHFSFAFKSRFGLSPSAYRRTNHQ